MGGSTSFCCMFHKKSRKCMRWVVTRSESTISELQTRWTTLLRFLTKNGDPRVCESLPIFDASKQKKRSEAKRSEVKWSEKARLLSFRIKGSRKIGGGVLRCPRSLLKVIRTGVAEFRWRFFVFDFRDGCLVWFFPPVRY